MPDAIEMKAGASRAELAHTGLLHSWEERRLAFLDRFRAARFGAVILDYDGTVYDGGQLDNALPDAEMAALLAGLLEKGIALGFASGRGESLRAALRQTFPEASWPLIQVAYQDGAETGSLADNALPTPYSPELEDAALARARQKLAEIFAFWPHPPFMRSENKLLGLRCQPGTIEHVFATSCAIALPLGLKAFKSGRMVDIVPQKVGKRNLEKHIAVPGKPTLALGDAGAWPGNDCELLDSPYGVSVGTVSAHPDFCWRITRAEGVAGAREILNKILRR